MATITNFRELKCWQVARMLAKDIYSLTRHSEFAKDYGLKDQIQRAAVSIGSNIAEGFERDSNAEFMKFLSYAKGSVGEVSSQLYTALDVGYVTLQELETLEKQLMALGRMIGKLQVSLKNSDLRGRYHTRPETRNSEPETLLHVKK